jgi:hypothetical protein
MVRNKCLENRQQLGIYILDQVKDCNLVANRGYQAIPIWCEEKVSFAIYRTEEV